MFQLLLNFCLLILPYDPIGTKNSASEDNGYSDQKKPNENIWSRKNNGEQGDDITDDETEDPIPPCLPVLLLN